MCCVSVSLFSDLWKVLNSLVWNSVQLRILRRILSKVVLNTPETVRKMSFSATRIFSVEKENPRRRVEKHTPKNGKPENPRNVKHCCVSSVCPLQLAERLTAALALSDALSKALAAEGTKGFDRALAKAIKARVRLEKAASVESVEATVEEGEASLRQGMKGGAQQAAMEEKSRERKVRDNPAAEISQLLLQSVKRGKRSGAPQGHDLWVLEKGRGTAGRHGGEGQGAEGERQCLQLEILSGTAARRQAGQGQERKSSKFCCIVSGRAGEGRSGAAYGDDLWVLGQGEAQQAASEENSRGRR